MQPGLPLSAYGLVMAETQRSPESVRSVRRVRASWIRQDSAACVSLSSIHLSKSARGEATTTPGPACAAPFIVETRPFTRSTQESLALNPEIADRKSTRLNSSHLGISYAVFCLKKK